MDRTKIAVLLLGVLALVSAGCQRGPQFAPVEGTVTKDGKPLAGVIVDFYPDSGTPGPRSTSAATDEAGHYRLRSTRNGVDGAAVGTHRVCILNFLNVKPNLGVGGKSPLGPLPEGIENLEIVQKELSRNAKHETPQVPSSYSDPNETPLRREVRPGAQVIDLEVKDLEVK